MAPSTERGWTIVPYPEKTAAHDSASQTEFAGEDMRDLRATIQLA